LAIRPNKPILFSVDHEPDDVRIAISKFREAIAGKKFLFIELLPEEVELVLKKHEYSSMRSVEAYQRLASEAMTGGLKVIALDNKKFVDEIKRITSTAYIVGWSHFDASAKRSAYYQIYIKREKAWLRKLEGVGSNAVVVMNPGHSAEIAKQLKIPKENIIGSLWHRKKARALAGKEAVRVQAARIERKKVKAKMRSVHLPK